MNKYYCPYCNPKYQFAKENYGKLVCGLCGEDLIKKPTIQMKQIVALLLVVVFSLPVILIIFSAIKNIYKQRENELNINKSITQYEYKLLTSAK